MTGKEVRALQNDEVTLELGRLRRRLYELGVQTVTEKVEDNTQSRLVRRDVARLMGERRAREIAGTWK